MDIFTQGTACISPCGTYRYRLNRTWDETRGRVVWVMLNPSSADAEQDDPAIRRCVGFARAWGYGAIEVVNLFAARCTYPKELRKFPDAVGPDNDQHIQDAVRNSEARLVIAAWGRDPYALTRAMQVKRLIRSCGVVLQCLGMTKNGRPKHPLYLPSATQLIPFL